MHACRQIKNPISPGYVVGNLDPANPAIQATLGLLGSTYLPKGTDDSGGVGPAETDWTIYTTIRDHTNLKYYYRRV